MISCPICGREMNVRPRARAELWTRQQVWLVRKLRATGASRKLIARVLGCPPSSISGLEARLRHERRAGMAA